MKHFDGIKKGPVIFFGNEFFDAIPIKQFKIRGNKLYEKILQLIKIRKLKKFIKKLPTKLQKISGLTEFLKTQIL